jgi:hypothetical protein
MNFQAEVLVVVPTVAIASVDGDGNYSGGDDGSTRITHSVSQPAIQSVSQSASLTNTHPAVPDSGKPLLQVGLPIHELVRVVDQGGEEPAPPQGECLSVSE